jgi:rubredoxin
MKNILQRILIKGGVLSPGELKQIVNLAEELGLKTVNFGSRQDILFPYDKGDTQIFDQYPNIQIDRTEDRIHQNIVCSYVSADIFPSTDWLKGSTYLYILEQFRFTPKLKVNICDPKQQLVPLFTGQINFIASKFEDYWHLYLNLPNWKASVEFPVLIYSWDIPNVVKSIEHNHTITKNVDELHLLIHEKLETNSRTKEDDLVIPFHPFPYYEGMNKMGDDEYWLGLYWRNNEYDLAFLSLFCDFCLETKVGKICITPWKSFIVKGIHRKHKIQLEKLLGKRGINVRHSLLELNWHLPLADQEALNLKNFIVRNFDQNDISTYGLNFGIANRSLKNSYFTTIVVEKNIVPTLVKEFQIRPTFNVLYSKHFNPNNGEYLIYAQDVDKMELPGLLMELSKLYYDKLGENELEESSSKDKLLEIDLPKEVFQCKDCLTIYDQDLGDELNTISPGIPFEDLPDDFCCSVCESKKDVFQKVIL